MEKKDIPLLGICRGLQVVNVWCGGSLVQHLEGHFYLTQQYLFDKKNMSSTLASIFRDIDEPFIGYSFHHQAVDVIGKGLSVIASSKDGTIKGMEMSGKRFGVLIQWHPEFKGDLSTPEAAVLDAKLSPGNHELYKQFIKACE